MTHYRAYLFKADLLSSVHSVWAEDDRRAPIKLADVFAEGYDVEIWDGMRLVVRRPSQSPRLSPR